MMLKRTLALLIATTSLCGRLGAANLGGSDDFDDNIKDPAKWGADTGFAIPVGNLTETNGRLEFTATQTDSFVRRPWLLNLGSYVESWAVQIDTTIAAFAGVGRGMGFDLEIRKEGDSTLRMGIRHESEQSSWDYFTYLLHSSGTQGSATLPAVSAGALRITFDAEAKVLASFYDADGPANGYVWTQAASFGIAGSGGESGSDDWGMTAGDHFQVGVQGSALGRSVISGLVYGDNFLAVPEPWSAGLLGCGGVLFLALHRHRPSNRGADQVGKVP
jgi:hypothetical protein